MALATTLFPCFSFSLSYLSDFLIQCFTLPSLCITTSQPFAVWLQALPLHWNCLYQDHQLCVCVTRSNNFFSGCILFSLVTAFNINIIPPTLKGFHSLNLETLQFTSVLFTCLFSPLFYIYMVIKSLTSHVNYRPVHLILIGHHPNRMPSIHLVSIMPNAEFFSIPAPPLVCLQSMAPSMTWLFKEEPGSHPCLL